MGKIKIRMMMASLLLAFVITGVQGQQGGVIRGTVEDQMGPVAGAAVQIKGTTTGTVTDADGRFSLNASSGQTLVISFIGYVTKEVKLSGEPSLAIHLVEDSKLIDEVVVTALGITKESRALGYAVSTIDAGEITKVGTPNFGAALYGKAAGVRIQSSTGGNSSSVSVTVRGLNSLTGNTQPMLIVDGVPVRNGNANNDGRWDGDRIYGNGLTDINPEDIESLSILKGAAASALYGSEAANGVILVTTKKGRTGTGLGIEFNANIQSNIVAYMPKVQTTFGPGRWSLGWQNDYQKEHGGIDQITYKGQTYERVVYQSSHDYGPRYDGRTVLFWDGSVRKYEAITNSPYSDLFRTGLTQTYNVAITKGGDNSNARFSYTYVDEIPNQYNSTFAKHNLSVVGALKLHENVQLDYTANYIRQNIFNRPRSIGGMIDNMSNQFTSYDDVQLMRKKAVTSLGYKGTYYDSETAQSFTPDENFAYNNPSAAFDYYWDIYGKEQTEANNRLLASVSPRWQFIHGLTLRGRMSTDLTANAIERKEHTETPLIYRINERNKTGGYLVRNENYNIFYGDIMLMLDRDLIEELNLTANVGYQARQEDVLNTQASTEQGLATENWFHLNSSVEKANSSMTKSQLLKTAYLGSAGLSYKHTYYLEGTMRQEKTSTLAPGNNAFFYPSVNASYVFSEQLKERFKWLYYGKLRASYGIVGNAPDIYRANIAYNQSSMNGIAYNTIPGDIGNDAIRPETKYEWEFGLETKLFNNRIGLELSYYTNRVEDQILPVQTISSIGGSTILQNVGTISNNGLELTLNARPVEIGDFAWDIVFNYGFNRGKVVALADGSDVLEHNANNQNAGGAIRIQSRVGQQMGDIMAYAPETDGNGNILIYSSGDFKGYPVVKYGDENLDKIGNALPDAVGGFGTTLSYKGFFLDAMLDYRIGGYVVSDGYQYTMARGINPNSVAYRDEQSGGLAYYYLNNDIAGDGGNTVPYTGSTPNGELVYHNGMIVPGVLVDENGNPTGEKNNIIVPADAYYNIFYNVGTEEFITFANSVFENSYLKMRELSLGYRFPARIADKIGCKNLSASLFGRNLFYFFKNKSGYDPETTSGTAWQNQIFVGTATTASTRSFGLSLRANF